MKREDRRPWIELAPSPAFLRALGGLTVQWAHFESEFNGAIQFLLMGESEHTGAHRKLPFKFDARVALFCRKALSYFSRCPALVSRLTSIADEAVKLKKTRDHIAHCHWLGDAKTGVLTTYIERQGGNDIVVLDLELIKAAIFDVSVITRKIMAFSHAGGLYRDMAFAMTAEEESEIIEFRKRHLKLPPPNRQIF